MIMVMDMMIIYDDHGEGCDNHGDGYDDHGDGFVDHI